MDATNPHSNWTRRSLIGLGPGALLLGVRGWWGNSIDREPSAVTRPTPDPRTMLPTIPEPEPDWEGIELACRAAIEATLDRDLRAVSAGLVDFSRFFNRIRPRVGPMIDDLFDLGSTAKILWKSGRDQLDGGDRCDQYVARFLAAYLEMPDGLELSFTEFEQSLSYALNLHEQELAMSLDAELAPVADRLVLDDLATSLDPIDRDLARDSDRAAVGQALLGAGLLALDPGSFVLRRLRSNGSARLSSLGPRLAASIGVKVGGRAASGAILSAGAASSPWTAGLGFLASIAITLLIESIANKVARNHVERQLVQGLDLMHREIAETFEAESRRLVVELRDRRVTQIQEALADARASRQEMP